MRTILVVEDDEMSRSMLTRRLLRRGYTVSTAVDGLEGLASARHTRPDIILMDLDLPVLDGWTVTRRLKADAVTADIPVIALTAHALVDDAQRALAAGCDGYATKPIDLPRLLARIEALVQLRHA